MEETICGYESGRSRRKIEKPLESISTSFISERIQWFANVTNPVWNSIPDCCGAVYAKKFFELVNESAQSAMNNEIIQRPGNADMDFLAETFEEYKKQTAVLRALKDKYSSSADDKEQDAARREFQDEYIRYVELHVRYYDIIHGQLADDLKETVQKLSVEGIISKELEEEVVGAKIPALKESFLEHKIYERKTMDEVFLSEYERLESDKFDAEEGEDPLAPSVGCGWT